MNKRIYLLMCLLISGFMLRPPLSHVMPSTGRIPANAGFLEDEQKDSNEGEALYSTALEMARNGRYPSAARAFAKAIDLTRKANQHKRVAEMLVEMADCHLDIGKWAEAITYYRDALDLERLPDQIRLHIFLSKGRLFTELQHFRLSIAYYKKALSLVERTKDLSGRATALVGLASVSVELGSLKEAANYIDQVPRLSASTEAMTTNAKVLWLRGRLHYMDGRMSEAKAAMEQALQLFETLPNTNERIALLCDLSRACLELNDKTLAYHHASQAAGVTGIKAVELRARTSLTLARVQRALGQNEQALNSYHSAVGRAEQQLVYGSPDVLRISLLEQAQACYRECADLLMEMDREDEAIKVAEHAHARALLVKISALDASVKEQKTLQDVERSITRLQTDVFFQTKNSPRLPILMMELEEAQLKHEELELEIQLGNPKRFGQPIKPSEVRARVLRSDQVLISFLLGKERSYAWSLSRAEVKCAVLPGQAEIEQKVKNYITALAELPNRLTLRRKIAHEEQLGHELFSILLGGFSDQLNPTRSLIIVPDGLLSYLPFEALLRDHRYLIQDHDISYAPSMTVFSLLNAIERPRRTELDWLAFGAPVIRWNSPRGPRNEAFRLSPLPGTLDEIDTISKLFSPERRRAYVGHGATESGLKLELMKRCRYLHIASHGLVDPDSPARTAVALSMDSNRLEDGLLRIPEIAALNLRCDLVVLSTCRSAQGQLMRGEGVVGFTRAFLQSGARAVAVSLWDVGDHSTMRFMEVFYSHLVSGDHPVKALRLAKIALINSDGKLRHPYHWASFILVGSTN